VAIALRNDQGISLYVEWIGPQPGSEL